MGASRKGILAGAGELASGVVAVLRGSGRAKVPVRTGTFSNDVEYAVLGSGPRNLVFLPGGVPGCSSWEKAPGRKFLPWYVTDTYSVWWLSRRRHMPTGHTIADMADDVADVIVTELDGRVDGVIGASYGGMIALAIGARHPQRVGRIVLLSAAAAFPDWAIEESRRTGEALGHGRYSEAAEISLEDAFRGERRRWLRRLAAPFLGRVFRTMGFILPDVLVETQAMVDFDGRPLLGQITVPTLLIVGDRDDSVPPELVEETARGIPDARIIWHKGEGHSQAIMNKQTAAEVLSFVAERRTADQPTN